MTPQRIRSSTERVVGTLASQRGRVALILSGANYGQAAVGFLVNFYLARTLGAEGYGLVSYGLVIATVVFTVVNFGAERTLVRDIVQREDKPRVLTASLALRALLGLLVGVLVAAIVLSSGASREKALVVMLCTVAACFWALYPVAWFDAHYRMHHQALVTLVERILYGVGILAMIRSDSLSEAVTVAALLLGTRALSLLAQMLLTRRSVRFDFGGFAANAKGLLRGNAYIVAAALANLMISHWNQLSLESRLSLEHLGYYSLAFQLIAVVTLLQNQVLRFFAPRVAELTATGADPFLAARKLSTYMAFGAVVSAGIVLPLLLAAPWLIRSVFGGEYLPALSPLRVLGAWVVFTGAARMINSYLVSLHLDQTFFWSAAIAGVLAVALGWWLIPIQAETGVALSLLISHPVSVAVQYRHVRKELNARKAAWTAAV